MTAGDVARRGLPIVSAAFAVGVAVVVSVYRAIDEATRSIGRS